MLRSFYIAALAGLMTLTISATHSTQGSMQTIVIKTTIYCDHCLVCETCGQKFDNELAYEKGIRLVVVDEKAMTITVTYNSKKTNPDTIRQTISKMGFDADDVKADPAAYDKLDSCCKKP